MTFVDGVLRKGERVPTNATRTIRRALRALSKVNSIDIKTNITKTTPIESTLTHFTGPIRIS
jgi:hypothetical protein